MNSQQHPKLAVVFLGIGCIAAVVALEAVAQQQESKQPLLLISANIDANVVPTGCDSPCCGGACCKSVCCCESVCCPKRVEKDVKKHCWNVKCKEVCIPGFRWPWERCQAKSPSCGDCCDTGCEACEPKCGRVRCISVLEKYEYKCKKCGYEWEVKRVCTSTCPRNSGSCGCPECGGQGCD